LRLVELRALGDLASPAGGTSTPIQNPFADPSLLESESDMSFSRSTLQETAQTRQRLIYQQDNEGAIAQREREIEDIAQGIIELATIFQDLQAMVIDQGTMLDRIDYNVENMSTDVKAAAEELTVASGYQRRSLKRKILLLLVIIIVGMFILLGLKLSGKSAPPVTPNAPIPPGSAEVPAGLRRLGKRFPMETLHKWAYAHLHAERDWRRRKRRIGEMM
jgi:syntaxin 16